MKKLLLALGLFLALASPATAQNTTCSDRPPADSSNACANTRFVQSVVNSTTLIIEQFGGGCSKADTVNTTALTAAVNSTAGPVRVLFPQSCNYELTGNFLFNKAVWLEGAQLGTRLKWNPTADGTFLKWAAPVAFAPLTYGGLKNLTVWTRDSTYTKTMIESVAISNFRIENVSCGYDPSFGGNVTVVTGGTGSICYYPQGWDFGWIQNFWFAADKPIRIGMNPYWSYAQDHWHWSNGYIQATSNIGVFPLISVDPGVAFSNTAFDHIAMVNGSHGFFNNDTGAINQVYGFPAGGTGYAVGDHITVTESGTVCPVAPVMLVLSVSGGAVTAASVSNPGQCNTIANGNPWTQTSTTGSGTGAQISAQYNVSFGLTFDHIRSEQGGGTPATNWSFFIAPTWGQATGTQIANVVTDGVRNGIFLKNSIGTKLSQIINIDGSGTPAIAVSATAAFNNDMVEVDNSLWAPSANLFVDFTGQCVLRTMPSPALTNASIPPFALYSSTICSQTLAGLNVTGSLTAASAPVTLTGNISTSSWGLDALLFKVSPTSIFTDTTSSGTVTQAATNRLGGETIAASSPTTYSDYFGTVFQGPQAGTNVTFTRRYGLQAAEGRIDRARIFTEDLGQNGLIGGTLNVYGITSGVGSATAQAVMGTPAWVFPTNSGTFAVSATAPLAINATTGNATCATCVTSSGGGAITGTAPISVSAAGVVSLNNTAVTPSSYGSATASPTYTVDAQGRLTAAANVTITPAIGSITGLGTGVATALGTAVGSAGGPITFNGAGGTPSAITLTNGTGLPTTGLTGTLQAAQEPAHTGDVTNSAGSLGLTLVAGNAGNLNSGTLLAARMPALTGDCTTSAGAVATTCTKINGVDQTVAWTTYSPTVTGGGGSCGACSITATGRSRQIGKTYIAEMDINITAIGSWTGALSATLPATSAAFRYTGTCFEYNATGKSGAGYINGPSTPTLFASRDAAAGSWFVNGYQLACTITYEIP